MKYTFTLLSIFLFSLLKAQDVTLTYAKKIGGNGSDYNSSLVLDAVGNVYTTGTFNFQADFNPDPVETFFMTPASNYQPDVYITKFDAAGNFVWAKQFKTAAEVHSTSIAVDAAGNVYTTGYFRGTTDFDPD